MKPITESHIETFAIEQLQSLGWQYVYGLAIAPGAEASERNDFEQVLLTGRIRKAIAALNPFIPADVQEQAVQKLLRIYSPDLLHNNETFHEFLVEKVRLPYQQDGYERSHEVALFDFDTWQNNEFLIVNQFTIVENNNNKRPDILLFVNGIPLVVIELKNAADEKATLRKAFDQIQTYKATIPSLFTFNSICIISDGHECKAGSVSAGFSRYMTWKTADGIKEASRFAPQLETLIKGMLQPATLLDLVRNFVVFEKTKKEDPKTGITRLETVKKLAAYHQYYAVNKAIESTLIAAGVKNFPPLEGWSQTGVVTTPPVRHPSKGGELRASKNYFNLPYNPNLKQRARELRQAGNLSEVLLWNQVKNKQFKGYDFDRQKIIGNYIVDFYCTNCNVVIEIDGSSHDDKQEYDDERDKFLESLGITIIHIPVINVFQNMNGVMEMLFDHPALCSEPPRPSGTPPKEENDSSLREVNFGNRKAGVVWHTQGSGKSLSMVFYSGKLITAPEMQNPTIVVLTDRNDLDDQLYETFAGSRQLLRQDPVQAKDRDHLRDLLKVASGGIVFTTIQKFLPETGKSDYDLLSDRRNIVVIADEAHRTQYGFEAKMVDVKDKETKEKIGERVAYGFAKYMRDALKNATYIGFTGTPIEGTDVNTPQVFGQYIDRYDIRDAVEDGATVRIFYESRLAKVTLNEEGKRLIEEFEASITEPQTEDEANSSSYWEEAGRRAAKAKWTKLEAIIGHPERLKNLAKDIISHFEERQKVFEGKGLIVTMSRRIAVELYKQIIALRPEWHDDDLTKGRIKVVMTAASADGPEMEKHHTTKGERKYLAERLKDDADPLQLVLVRDMWLTGFDAPSLHTMYVDKPMRGHNLMQAIARVNRVFKDKPGGLVVDYLGIATDLKKALSFYSDAGGKGDPTESIEKAVEVMLEKLEVVQQLFNEETKSYKDILVEEPEAYYQNSFKFNYRRFFKVDAREKLSIILQAEEHILGLQDGKERFIREVTLLSQAFSFNNSTRGGNGYKRRSGFFSGSKSKIGKV